MTQRKHLTCFADQHAEPILFEVRTNVKWFNANGELTYGDWKLRGSRLEAWDVPPPHSLNDLAHLVYSGPGWRDHCFPAPAYDTDLSF